MLAGRSCCGSSTSWWCDIGRGGIAIYRDGCHWAARGWDLDGAGWDRDLHDAGGNLDGDDRGPGADDWNAARVDDFTAGKFLGNSACVDDFTAGVCHGKGACIDDLTAGICHGNSACVWDRRATGDCGNWGGIDDSGRNVCG